jgi:hypothetical protein
MLRMPPRCATFLPHAAADAAIAACLACVPQVARVEPTLVLYALIILYTLMDAVDALRQRCATRAASAREHAGPPRPSRFVCSTAGGIPRGIAVITRQIFAKGYTGRTITIDVSPHDTNLDVLDRHVQKTGEPVVHGIYEGKQLNLDAPCTVAKHDTIHVLPRMLGGVGSVRVPVPALFPRLG